MISTGVQRPRFQKRSFAEQVLFAGFFLALSTQTVSHQDVLFRFEAGVELSERWRVHMIARSGPDGGARKFAALIGPGLDEATSVALDPMATGSIDTDPTSISRHGKADSLAEPPPPRLAYNAGFLEGSELFAPIDPTKSGARVAFVLPKADPAVSPEDEVSPKDPVTKLADATPDDSDPANIDGGDARPTAVGYAPSDDALEGEDGAPFKAVMARSGKGAVVLDPDIGATHAWVNYAIPKNSTSKKERTCLANAIYFEARGEPERGRIAVAQVVLNRLKNPAYPNTICSVVYQNKHKRNACQFSFACDGISDRVTDKKSWVESQALAERILEDDRTLFQSDVGAATHYHANYVRPKWARSMKKTQKIGRHIFYKTRGGGWS